MWGLEYQPDRTFWYIPIELASILPKSLYLAVCVMLCCNCSPPPPPHKIIGILPLYNKPPLLILPDTKG